jgi:hypothetical protein
MWTDETNVSLYVLTKLWSTHMNVASPRASAMSWSYHDKPLLFGTGWTKNSCRSETPWNAGPVQTFGAPQHTGVSLRLRRGSDEGAATRGASVVPRRLLRGRVWTAVVRAWWLRMRAADTSRTRAAMGWGGTGGCGDPRLLPPAATVVLRRGAFTVDTVCACSSTRGRGASWSVYSLCAIAAAIAAARS